MLNPDQDALITQIKAVIDSLRPLVNSHNGDIEFIAYEAGKVTVAFSGACIGCPFSYYTLKMGIEKQLKEQIPSVQEVCAEER